MSMQAVKRSNLALERCPYVQENKEAKMLHFILGLNESYNATRNYIL